MLSETNGNSKFNNGGTGALVIVKATKEATDTILYSQHVIKIGSHNGQGEGEGEGGGGLLPNITGTGMSGPGFKVNLFWKSNKYLISLQGLIFLLFTHLHH